MRTIVGRSGVVALALLVWGCGPQPQRTVGSVDRAAPAGPPPLAGPSMVGRIRGRTPIATIRGRVTAVDKPLGLCVVSVGYLHGVRSRDTFIVHRGEHYIGRIVIDDVYPDYSAARYGREMRADVEPGDRITTRLLAGD